jgi:hypothetical protein
VKFTLSFVGAAVAAASLAGQTSAETSIFNFVRPDQSFIDAHTVPSPDWTYEMTDPSASINESAGLINAFSTSYDDVSQQLTWSITFGGQPDGSDFHRTEGFWLVLTGGDLPLTHGQVAQLAFDASGPTPILTGYGYNNSGGIDSFFDGSGVPGNQPADKIFSSLNDVNNVVQSLSFVENPDGSSVMSFTINASTINSHAPLHPGLLPWTGASFGDEIGIWLHTMTNVNSTYNGGGFLSSFEFARHGWVDLENGETIPAPGALCLLALAGMVGTRRRG